MSRIYEDYFGEDEFNDLVVISAEEFLQIVAENEEMDIFDWEDEIEEMPDEISIPKIQFSPFDVIKIVESYLE